jgi:hypothetical protein
MSINYNARARVTLPGVGFTTTLSSAIRYVMASDPEKQHLATIGMGDEAGTDRRRLGFKEIKEIAERPDFPKV